jgi:hypothetical protein
MENRACAQVGIPEKLAKLKHWRDHPEWTTRAAAKELGVPRGTLLGWKKELWTKLDDAKFAEKVDGRIRVKTRTPHHKLTSYEMQILEYHDTCLREDGKVVHGDLVKYGRTIPDFAILNEGTQLSWISRFIDRCKMGLTDRPIPANVDESGGCAGDSVHNKYENASLEEEKASLEKQASVEEKQASLEEKEASSKEKKTRTEKRKARTEEMKARTEEKAPLKKMARTEEKAPLKKKARTE